MVFIQYYAEAELRTCYEQKNNKTFKIISMHKTQSFSNGTLMQNVFKDVRVYILINETPNNSYMFKVCK